ncbi:23S rRNA methyltransferase [Steroidobacter denitrificans]|uniref:23S rRNA (guanosine-2'-O-)-methyltransferase RlmB n=1 Tax=Steroidobacter denitrificans TaxID=465721 RepID=A0A127F7K8_STEDE|nr:23S rRNA (guanosine(2251)-2'-O)-methyltransferase RlmB [Steroidobacter denitrificans]AMN46387.1 23S rRNA methyltransferase [Steroidobacter denitrificans]
MSDQTIVFGIHAVRTLLQRRPERAARLMLQKGRQDARVNALLTLAQSAGVDTRYCDTRELDRLAGHQRHQGACLQVHAMGALGEGALDELLDRAAAAPLLLVLDGVQDPHNLGACLRTADAAGVTAVIVPRDRAAGLSPAVRKVASGAAETMPLIQVVNLARTLRWLKERDIWIVGADGQATTRAYQATLDGPLALVLGAEEQGLRRLTREQCDLLVGIPMQGVVESLNVSVASGILLYEAVRQRETAAARRR